MKNTVKPTTWPLFRLAQRARGNAKWEVAPFLDDEKLQLLGYGLAGPGRDATALTPQEQDTLFAHLLEHAAHPPKGADSNLLEDWKRRRKEESALLGRVPFCRYLPPVDVDVAEGVTHAEKLEAVRKLDPELLAHGLGGARWCTTGGRGLHGDLMAPREADTPHLLRSAGERLRSAAKAAGLPLLSEHRSKDGRPRIVVDDTLFERQPTSRGVQWALINAAHGKTGQPKKPLGSLSHAKVPYRPQPIPGTTELRELPPATWEEIKAAHAHLEQVKDSAPEEGVVRVGSLIGQLVQLGRGALKAVANVAKKLKVGEGKRHWHRLALAGLLLRAGVPMTAAVATIQACSEDDPQDAAKAVRSTAARIQAGKPAKGIPALKAIVGEAGVKAYQSALELDFRRGGVRATTLPSFQWPTKQQREVCKAASKTPCDEPVRRYHPELDRDQVRGKVEEKTARRLFAKCEEENRGFHRVRSRNRALRAASVCGFAEAHRRCGQCKTTYCKHRVLCESNACLYCHAKRQHGIFEWIKVRWPEKVWVTVVEIKNGTEYARCLQRKRFSSSEAEAEGRWIYAPGYLAFIAATKESAVNLCMRLSEKETIVRARECSREAAATALVPVLAARVHHLHDLQRTGATPAEQNTAVNRQLLRWDEWIGNLKESTATERGVTDLPWPTSKSLREFMKEQRAAKTGEPPPDPVLAKLSPCCKAPTEHAIAVKDKVLTPWKDTPWGRTAALRFARGLRMVEGKMIWPSGRVARLILPEWSDPTEAQL